LLVDAATALVQTVIVENGAVVGSLSARGHTRSSHPWRRGRWRDHFR
jgi:hypothetical protein